ncbi:hypothetical protein VT84_26915 [Gemmata sp. SH-PL17]|uniref:Uncharacterized protein n=1 Tax=Gemmata massiliana TaxID=1210884 RepID=A0A6P2D7A7_9BACT|nr:MULTISPECIES: hypothetical protein [Gemmata]AMV28066.1 hypothetical protein VT84_26915 [Gemmata sp. SH-PL17]VTR96817.1 unnamed protein product [Gemmata massiliana]
MGFLIVCAACLFFLMLVPVTLFALTFIYRSSCVLCGLPKPTVMVASGIMFVAWLSLVMAVGVLDRVVHEACNAAGLPPWEAAIIVFLLALPLDLLISAGIESGLMGVRFGKGVEVWYTQRLIQLSIIVAIGFVVGVIVLIQQLV